MLISGHKGAIYEDLNQKLSCSQATQYKDFGVLLLLPSVYFYLSIIVLLHPILLSYQQLAFELVYNLFRYDLLKIYWYSWYIACTEYSNRQSVYSSLQNEFPGFKVTALCEHC